jgi:hypothetical protein
MKKPGFGLHLPNLPKADYLVLKKRRDEWQMSMVQIVLLGLRAIEHLPDATLRELTEQVVKDV